jgi:hypothetical protein
MSRPRFEPKTVQTLKAAYRSGPQQLQGPRSLVTTTRGDFYVMSPLRPSKSVHPGLHLLRSWFCPGARKERRSLVLRVQAELGARLCLRCCELIVTVGERGVSFVGIKSLSILSVCLAVGMHLSVSLRSVDLLPMSLSASLSTYKYTYGNIYYASPCMYVQPLDFVLPLYCCTLP